MFISKMAIERRTFLRGVGATLALPLLDAMVPALTAVSKTAAKAPPRIGFVYHPMGTIYDQWTPRGEGTTFEMSRAPSCAGLTCRTVFRRQWTTSSPDAGCSSQMTTYFLRARSSRRLASCADCCKARGARFVGLWIAASESCT